MMNLATLTIQIAIVAFLAWGGVLSLVCMVRDAMWDSRPAD
jgi:hypothetical protein